MRRALLTVSMIAALGGASGGSASALSLKSTASATLSPWGAFSVETLKHGLITVDAVRVKTRPTSSIPEAYWIAEGADEFWIFEKTAKSSSGSEIKQWTDSRSCGAVTPSLEKLAAFEAVKLTAPDAAPGEQTVMVKGSAYKVSAPGIDPARHDAALALWTDGALRALTPCWSDTPPLLE